MRFLAFSGIVCLFFCQSVYPANSQDALSSPDDSTAWSFGQVITGYDDFTYLEEMPVESLRGDVSGLCSTDDIDVVASVLSEIKASDLVFFDYDEVLYTAEVGENGPCNCRLTHDAMRKIFFSTKRNASTYLISFGNNYVYEGDQFKMRGKKISEPVIDENGCYINPLSNDGDFIGLAPSTVLIASGGVVDSCIDFGIRGKAHFREPVLSIYPTLGAFQVGRPFWCPDLVLCPNSVWCKFPDSKIEEIFGVSGCTREQLLTLKYLYLRAPVKGKIIKIILNYLSALCGLSVPRDIVFVDDSLLNCKAFLFYVRGLKHFGYFTGNVKVVHLTLPGVPKNPYEELAIQTISESLARQTCNSAADNS